MKNKVGISILVLVISGCVLLSAAFIVGGFFLLKAQKNYIAPTAVITTTEPSTEPATPIEEGTLSPEIIKQMDQIQKEVQTNRGLNQKADLDRALMTPEELEEVVINDFFKDYTDEDAREDGKVLSTLGLLEPGFDLHQFYLDLYSEQIAGYYDQETKEMYVIAGETFGGMERMTYAHEFTHVLQDQNYDLENGMKLNDETCEADTEYCAAVTALIEGDATLSETQWFIKYSTKKDKQDLLTFQNDYSSPVYDSAPAFMKQDFLFPYDQGYAFVETLYNAGGWQAVDDAYARPPISTEQILHPEKYPSDTPVKVEMPDFKSMLGDGWSELDNNVMGEWYTYLILAQGYSDRFQMDDEAAKTAAEGWGGDTYLYYADDDSEDYLFVWRSSWETPQDADEFFSLSADYGKARWGIPSLDQNNRITWTSDTDGQITMRKAGKEVLWLMSSSKSISDSALQLLTGFNN